MEFHQLNYFLAAAQTQNFRKAAELCIVAQSALSRQIAMLEDELEVALFTRNKKRVTLTEEGQEFALYVRNAMEQLQEGGILMSVPQPELRAGASLLNRHTISKSRIKRKMFDADDARSKLPVFWK